MEKEPKRLSARESTDCQHILIIGEMRTKMAFLQEKMLENYADLEVLDGIFLDEHQVPEAPGSITAKADEARLEALIASRLGIRENAEEALRAARYFIELRNVDMYAHVIEEGLYYKGMMETNKTMNTDAYEEQSAGVENAVQALKDALAKASNSSRFVSDIAVDAYVGTLRDNMGLSHGGASLGKK